MILSETNIHEWSREARRQLWKRFSLRFVDPDELLLTEWIGCTVEEYVEEKHKLFIEKHNE